MPQDHLTIGPILFHWPADRMRDFYFRIADEAPVDTVYLGEVVCSKRTPFFEPHYEEVAARLKAGGKTVVFCSLTEVMLPRERKMTESLCALEGFAIEANDTAALYHLRGKPHRIGQYLNVYNEDTLTCLAGRGATHVTVPAELPGEALATMAAAAEKLKVMLEIQVYGRVGLALSARCYHARAHERIKDNCQFVCETDEDGMTLTTADGTPFLAVNGIQTLSYTCLNLIEDLSTLQKMGVHTFRLSPHSVDMVKVATLFREVLDQKTTPAAALTALTGLQGKGFAAPFARGFFHHAPGYLWDCASLDKTG